MTPYAVGIEFPKYRDVNGTPWCFWDRDENYTDREGRTWRGGGLLEVRNSVADTSVAPQKLSFSLIGNTEEIRQTFMNMYLETVPVVVHWFWREATEEAWTRSPKTFPGWLGSKSLRFGGVLTAEIEPFLQERNAPTYNWTHEDHQRRFPGDRGFQFLRALITDSGAPGTWPDTELPPISPSAVPGGGDSTTTVLPQYVVWLGPTPSVLRYSAVWNTVQERFPASAVITLSGPEILQVTKSEPSGSPQTTLLSVRPEHTGKTTIVVTTTTHTWKLPIRVGPDIATVYQLTTSVGGTASLAGTYHSTVFFTGPSADPQIARRIDQHVVRGVSQGRTIIPMRGYFVSRGGEFASIAVL